MSEKPMTLQITFKSGAQIEVRCTEWSKSRGTYEWTTPAGVRPKLVSFDADEVAAVVRLR
jgi:hypothetical protein